MYGTTRMIQYTGNSKGEVSSGIQFVYEGQYQGDFKGFGSYIYYWNKRLVIGWWSKKSTINGQAIYYENGNVKSQGVFYKLDYHEKPTFPTTIKDFRK